MTVAPRVAFLGPAGTYSEEALRASAGGEVEEVPCEEIREAVLQVEEGESDACVVPIENSLEGSVTATLDVLAAEASNVRIAAEVVRPIAHCLIARAGIGHASVQRVLSHPQALAQCGRYLRAQLPEAERAVAASTAEAVRAVTQTEEPWGAIGSAFAAEVHGGEVLATDIQDEPGNSTRFVWLRRAGEIAAGPPWGLSSTPADKTSIVFWGFNDEAPGALVGVLSEFADRAVNLTKIESRPRRVGLGHYMFFADLAGGAETAPVAEALAALEARVQTLRVLGSYPVA